jgi:hypothetical protein
VASKAGLPLGGRGAGNPAATAGPAGRAAAAAAEPAEGEPPGSPALQSTTAAATGTPSISLGHDVIFCRLRIAWSARTVAVANAAFCGLREIPAGQRA